MAQAEWQSTTESDCRFVELAHTAEIGLCVNASSAAALFACAARAMFALIDGPTGAATESSAGSSAEAMTEFALTLTADDAEGLMVDWLNELVYLYETSHIAVAACQVLHWTPQRMEARVAGYRSHAAPRLHIKAVTYHQLVVRHEPDGWVAQVFFDI